MVSWSAPRAEQANIFAGQELGYYEELGIDFEYVTGQGSGDAFKQILAGNGDVGFVGPEAIYFGAEQGANVVGVYNIYPENIFTVLSFKDQNITKPQDLKGKQIGVLSLASGGRYNILTMLAKSGMKESDVTLVATGPNPAPFLERKIDAWSAITSQQYQLEQRGVPPMNSLPAKDYLNVPTDILAVREDVLQKDRDKLVRFLKAVKRGTELMIKDPQKAAEIGAKYALDIKEPPAALPIVKIFAGASENEGTKKNGLGWFDLDVISQGAQMYYDTGLIQKQIDAKKFFTNDLIKDL